MKKHFLLLGFFIAGIFATTAQTTNTVYGTGTADPYINYNPSFPLERINNAYFGYQVNFFYANRGSENAALGYQAFHKAKDAYRNNCFGSRSGFSNQLGNDNVLYGAFSGYTNFSGNSNINIGLYSGYTSYDKSYNVLIGGNSGRLNEADANTFIGYDSGAVNSSGSQNVFLGFNSGKANTVGRSNTFLGYQAGMSNIGTASPSSPGNDNTFVGNSAGGDNTTGNSNVFVGSDSGRYANTNYNICIGQYSGMSLSSGYGSNVFIGHGAGVSCTSATANVFIGHQAGLNNTTGVGNVFLGPRMGEQMTYATANDKLLIGRWNNANTAEIPLIYGDFFSRKIGIGLPNTYSATDGFPVTTGGSSPVNVSGYTLIVGGGILSTAYTAAPIIGNWADYVFDKEYKLNTLAEVEKFIKDNGHLPNIPSAKEIETSGFELANMAKLQQEKIEELTLYLIQQNKEIQELKRQNAAISELKEQVKALLNKKG
jgi:hypothetical protein